ncbi:carbonic anhydrase 4-like [Rhineura floridana]|uniref:carbonic anhydrase 4-like n=1 Tax=Rhineura floridana TaxID=261503 RepID=UPI002AC84944|nr:carbonic anhydrase 4-like [Rhineura floridana]
MESVAPTLKPAIHLWVLLLLGGFYVSCEESWCYDKPSCGPATWKSLGYCGGTEQSPININTEKTVADPCLGPLHFVGYEDRLRPQALKNTGHYPEIEMKTGATISGQGLPARYYLKSFHFHYGTNHHQGSEHAIDLKRYSMELHIVHTKDNMSLEEAKKDPQGFVVLAFFIEKSIKAPIVSAWKTLASLLEAIPEKGNSVGLSGQLSLGGLLSTADLSTYYRYQGSLTTPYCNEAVIWIVYPEPIKVPHHVVKKFTTSLYFTTKEENRRMQKNYRPLQPLNNRQVLSFHEDIYDPKRCSSQV